MDILDPYAPCPCGSGKKYKFCCRQKLREREESLNAPSFWLSHSAEGDEPEGLVVGDADEGSRLCGKGSRLMGAGEFAQAIPFLRQAVAAARPDHIQRGQ